MSTIVLGRPWWLTIIHLPMPINARDVDLILELGRFSVEKKWQPTPVFLLRKSHRLRSLSGCSPWGHRVRHNLTTKQPYYYIQYCVLENINKI